MFNVIRAQFRSSSGKHSSRFFFLHFVRRARLNRFYAYTIHTLWFYTRFLSFVSLSLLRRTAYLQNSWSINVKSTLNFSFGCCCCRVLLFRRCRVFLSLFFVGWFGARCAASKNLYQNWIEITFQLFFFVRRFQFVSFAFHSLWNGRKLRRETADHNEEKHWYSVQKWRCYRSDYTFPFHDNTKKDGKKHEPSNRIWNIKNELLVWFHWIEIHQNHDMHDNFETFHNLSRVTLSRFRQRYANTFNATEQTTIFFWRFLFRRFVIGSVADSFMNFYKNEPQSRPVQSVCSCHRLI